MNNIDQLYVNVDTMAIFVCKSLWDWIKQTDEAWNTNDADPLAWTSTCRCVPQETIATEKGSSGGAKIRLLHYTLA